MDTYHWIVYYFTCWISELDIHVVVLFYYFAEIDRYCIFIGAWIGYLCAGYIEL